MMNLSLKWFCDSSGHFHGVIIPLHNEDVEGNRVCPVHVYVCIYIFTYNICSSEDVEGNRVCPVHVYVCIYIFSYNTSVECVSISGW